jgi:predicted amidohydrolase YtcJ
MKSKLTQIFTFMAVSLLMYNCSNNADIADTIIHNGTIYTVDPSRPLAGAVATKAGKILFVGSMEEAGSFRGNQTKMIDLQGSTMTPGFIEGHAHFMGVGQSKLSLDLMPTTSYEELIQLVAAKVQTVESGEWITGRGWHQDKWDSISAPIVQGFPTHHALSAVSPDNPVFLKHASGHAALANARAMEIAGISAKTEADEGGEVFRDQIGEPTGIFNETAQGMISRHIPENDDKTMQRVFDMTLKTCLENGITGFHDAGAGPSVIDLYKKNLQSGKMRIRLYVMLDGSNQSLLSSYFATGPEIGLGDDFLTIRAIKLYGDGALGSRGAWLLDDYEDMPGEFGHSTTPIAHISEVCKEAVGHGFQVCTHAIGDRANHEVLNVYEEALPGSTDQPNALRFRIEHAQHLHPNDIPRFADLGVIPAMQAIHMSSDRPWAIDRLGEQRIVDGAYVWQDLLQSGARIVNGTDAPVEPIDPVACFFASVTRQTLEGTTSGRL